MYVVQATTGVPLTGVPLQSRGTAGVLRNARDPEEGAELLVKFVQSISILAPSRNLYGSVLNNRLCPSIFDVRFFGETAVTSSWAAILLPVKHYYMDP